MPKSEKKKRIKSKKEKEIKKDNQQEGKNEYNKLELRANIRIKYTTPSGWGLGKRLCNYHDPDGNLFKMVLYHEPNPEKEQYINVRYLSQKKEDELFPRGGDQPKIPISVCFELLDLDELASKEYEDKISNTDQNISSNQKVNTLHDIYKPGGIGYLFLKQSTAVGKKQ